MCCKVKKKSQILGNKAPAKACIRRGASFFSVLFPYPAFYRTVSIYQLVLSKHSEVQCYSSLQGKPTYCLPF